MNEILLVVGLLSFLLVFCIWRSRPRSKVGEIEVQWSEKTAAEKIAEVQKIQQEVVAKRREASMATVSQPSIFQQWRKISFQHALNLTGPNIHPRPSNALDCEIEGIFYNYIDSYLNQVGSSGTVDHFIGKLADHLKNYFGVAFKVIYESNDLAVTDQHELLVLINVDPVWASKYGVDVEPIQNGFADVYSFTVDGEKFYTDHERLLATKIRDVASVPSTNRLYLAIDAAAVPDGFWPNGADLIIVPDHIDVLIAGILPCKFFTSDAHGKRVITK